MLSLTQTKVYPLLSQFHCDFKWAISRRKEVSNFVRFDSNHLNSSEAHALSFTVKVTHNFIQFALFKLLDEIENLD